MEAANSTPVLVHVSGEVTLRQERALKKQGSYNLADCIILKKLVFTKVLKVSVLGNSAMLELQQAQVG